MNNPAVAFVLLGIVTGILAGFFGVGGGIVMVPALIYFFAFTQYQAQGISLTAMLLPVGVFGAYAYYKTNPFPVRPALWIALGILLGAYIGAMLAQKIPPKTLKTSFGLLMMIAAIKMIFGK